VIFVDIFKGSFGTKDNNFEILELTIDSIHLSVCCEVN